MALDHANGRFRSTLCPHNSTLLHGKLRRKTLLLTGPTVLVTLIEIAVKFCKHKKEIQANF